VLENKGLIQSLALRAQRELIREVAAELNAPVLFLKAAWADPVLYGNEGKRYGTDVDILVRREVFEDFAERLVKRGFRRAKGLGGERGRYFEDKETGLLPPKGSGYLPIDLHRGLTNPIWFNCNPDDLFSRSRTYEVGTEKITSLCPEDQIIHACLHYAGHALDLDSRHLEDIHLLVSAFSIDWNVVKERAIATRCTTMLYLLQSALRSMGSDIPVTVRLDFQMKAWAIRKLVEPDERMRRQRPRSRWVDYLLVRPLMSDDWTASVRFARHFGLPWLAETVRGRKNKG
jgi:Uncharacterised nucleotidyltransferase